MKTVPDPSYRTAGRTTAHGSRSSGNQRRADRVVKRARTLEDEHIERVLDHIERTSNSPRSDELKFVLSVYAGLRAAEIAGMTVSCMLDIEGRPSRDIIVSRSIAKRKRQRVIPMHPQIRAALTRFRDAHPEVDFIAFSKRHAIRRQGAGAVKSWFHVLYKQLGLVGASSHSGRRTFLTRLARVANQHNQSLRDVQMLAGHRRLSSTEAYIEPSVDTYDLVASLGAARRRRAA